MARQKEFVNYLVELLQPLGNVNAKAMFGGYGIYLDGLESAALMVDWAKRGYAAALRVAARKEVVNKRATR